MTKNVSFIIPFSTIFYPIKADLSGNTVRPKASDFLKFAKLTICGIL